MNNEKLSASHRAGEDGFIVLVRQSDNTAGDQSVEAQIASLKVIGEEKGLQYIDSISRPGLSGSLPGNRTDLDELFRRKREVNDFSHVLVQVSDRLTRGGSDHAGWVRHECARHAISLIVCDDIEDVPYAAVVRAAKFEAARDQARKTSMRCAQGAQLALEQERAITCSRTPFGCDRLFLSPDRTPLHRIRDLRDGRQQKLSPDGKEVRETLGEIGGTYRSRYRKQKHELVALIPGDPHEQQVVRDIIRWHYLDGLGGKKIADRLNRRGIKSPQRKQWSQRQVESIFEQPAYTGRTRGNEKSKPYYNRRRHSMPEPVEHSDVTLATSASIKVEHRPPKDWLWQDHPRMINFLGDEKLRRLVIAAHDRMHAERWQRRLDGTAVPHKAKTNIRPSDYLLSGMLVARQDLDAGRKPEPLVGHLSGRSEGPKTRYYRHKRGAREYAKGSPYVRLIAAEPLEQEVRRVVRDVLLDLPQLRETLVEEMTKAKEQVSGSPEVEVGALEAKRDEIRRRRKEWVRRLRPEELDDVKEILDELAVEAQHLDEQIASAKASTEETSLDPEEAADRIISALSGQADLVPAMPNTQLQALVRQLVASVVVDMETKKVKLIFRLPTWTNLRLDGENGDTEMCPTPSSQSQTGCHTHPPAPTTLIESKRESSVPSVIADVRCRYLRGQRSACYLCRDRK